MKRFFGTLAFLVIFTIIFPGSTALVFAAWPPDSETILIGYAQLSDSTSYKFLSDGQGYYTDVHLKPAGEPGEKIELAFKGDILDGVLLYLGKPDRISYPNPSPYGENPPTYCSSRKANFWFDILKDGKTTSQYKSYKAAFDILVWKDGNKQTRRGNPVSGKYYLNDNSVRLGIRRWVDTGGSVVHDIIFTIEPANYPCGSDACGPVTVTETAINAFYSSDKNYDYEDYRYIGTSGCDLVVYNIKFDNDFTFTKNGVNTWTVLGGGKAHLGVITRSGANTYFVGLADYQDMPFEVTVWTGTSLAPPGHNTTTTLWGELKSK